MYVVLTGDSLLPSLCERGHFPPGTDLILYEVCVCAVYFRPCKWLLCIIVCILCHRYSCVSLLCV